MRIQTRRSSGIRGHRAPWYGTAVGFGLGWLDISFNHSNPPLRDQELEDIFFVTCVGFLAGCIVWLIDRLRGLKCADEIALSEAHDGPITDIDLKRLAELALLTRVNLALSEITDAGLVHLKALTQLRHLDLDGTQVTDAGLEHLKGLTQLEALSLSYTQITDAGLERLHGLAHLEHLWLDGTQVTDAGVAKLQKALPHCQISR